MGKGGCDIDYERLRLRRELLRRRAVRSFPHFLVYSGRDYEMAWFHRVIAEKCQSLFEGRIKNLMIFVPPQHGKSEIVSRKFPAWAMGVNPSLRIVGCSYSGDLSRQFARSIQRTMDGDEYRGVFGRGEDARGAVRNADYFEVGV